MFDIGFSELAVIGVVALIVIGPEELPRVARTTGHLLGRLRRYVSDVKSDISREMEMADLKRVQESITDSARELQQSINEQAREFEQQFHQVASEATPEMPSIAPPPTPADAPPALTPAAEHVDVVAERDENQLDLFGEPTPKKGADS